MDIEKDFEELCNTTVGGDTHTGKFGIKPIDNFRKYKIKDFTNQALQAQKKAFGNCEKCYGKGYSTEMKGETIAHADFIGDKTRVLSNGKLQINYCDCERGKRLKEILQAQKTEIIKKIEGMDKKYRKQISKSPLNIQTYGKALDDLIKSLREE